MKIFIDGIAFGVQKHGGVSRLWAEYLKRLHSSTIEIKLLLPRWINNKYFDRRNAKKLHIDIANDYFCCPSRWFDDPVLRSSIIKIFYFKSKYTVFHSSYYSTIYSNGVYNIVSLYDMIPELFGDRSNKFMSSFIEQRKKVFENADKIIAISYNTKKDFHKMYPAVEEDKLAVIHLAPFQDYKHLNNDIVRLSAKYHIEIRPQEYFLFVGKRSEYKNFRIVAKLFKDYSYYKQFQLLCVGGEKEKSDILKIRKQEYGGEFVCLDFVDDEDMAILYRNAVALIYPSIYEGFGLPLLEAMTNECPVVCSAASSLPEIGGEAAFYFDPYSVESLNEAIQRMLVTERGVIVEREKKNIARFSWDDSVSKLIDTYNNAVK